MLLTSHKAKILRRSDTKDWTGQRQRTFTEHKNDVKCRIVASGTTTFKVYAPADLDVVSEDVIASITDTNDEKVANDMVIKNVAKARGYDGTVHHLELTVEALHLDVLGGVDDVPLTEV